MQSEAICFFVEAEGLVDRKAHGYQRYELLYVDAIRWKMYRCSLFSNFKFLLPSLVYPLVRVGFISVMNN